MHHRWETINSVVFSAHSMHVLFMFQVRRHRLVLPSPPGRSRASVDETAPSEWKKAA
jgi:hypothetical protein